MTADEIKERLRVIVERDDTDYERCHVEADELIAEYAALTDPEIAKLYEAVNKWYA